MEDRCWSSADDDESSLTKTERRTIPCVRQTRNIAKHEEAEKKKSTSSIQTDLRLLLCFLGVSNAVINYSPYCVTFIGLFFPQFLNLKAVLFIS